MHRYPELVAQAAVRQFFERSSQAFLLPENGETERGVKTIDKLGAQFTVHS